MKADKMACQDIATQPVLVLFLFRNAAMEPITPILRIHSSIARILDATPTAMRSILHPVTRTIMMRQIMFPVVMVSVKVPSCVMMGITWTVTDALQSAATKYVGMVLLIRENS